MVEKKLIALVLICAALSVAVIGAVMVLNQKDHELQIKTDQISGIENEKLTLETQIDTLQANVSNLQSEVGSLNTDNIALESQVTSLQTETTTLENENNALESQVSTLQSEATTLNDDKAALESQVTSLQFQVTSLENDKTSLEIQVAILQSEKFTLTTQVASLQTNVSSLQTQVTSLEDDKTSLETQVATLQANVSSLQSQVESLEDDKTSLEAQVASLYTEVANLEAEVIQSYYSGYNEGYAQGVEDLSQSGWYLSDPTYNEAIAFINSDTTDENVYGPDYVCYDFTADFNGNALQAGYRCGFVYIMFSDSAHALACFETPDMGLIYVEPQTDQIVTLAIGQPYLGHIIVDFGIIW